MELLISPGCCSSSSVIPTHPKICRLLTPALLTATSSGDSCPLFLFVQSLKSEEEAESAKGPQNELFEAKGKALASRLVLSPEPRKLQQLGLWTVSQPSIIFWEACGVDGVLGGPLLQAGSSYEAATAFSASPEARPSDGDHWLRRQCGSSTLHGLQGPAPPSCCG